MSARRVRGDPEWQALIAEHQVLKRKLQSKSEALLIISKDLERALNERDQFKLMAEKLQERCQAFKRQQADFPVTSDKASLIQMLKDIKNQKLAHQKHNELLQQKLNEADGDIKLLREKFARQTVGDERIGARHFPLHEREKLVSQLEESQQERKLWQGEYQSQIEVANEARSELEASRLKVDRLNQELSYLLTGDKKRIIDVDALSMENKYLQERITQCQAEKNSLHNQIQKYKNILNSRRPSKGDLAKPGLLRSSGIVMSPRQLKELLSHGSHQSSAEKVVDLQSIVSALLETINDKNLALHHLRSTNKILGNRVSDLESKLRTLEVAGLWNMQDVTKYNATINRVNNENHANADVMIGGDVTANVSKDVNVTQQEDSNNVDHIERFLAENNSNNPGIQPSMVAGNNLKTELGDECGKFMSFAAVDLYGRDHNDPTSLAEDDVSTALNAPESDNDDKQWLEDSLLPVPVDTDKSVELSCSFDCEVESICNTDCLTDKKRIDTSSDINFPPETHEDKVIGTQSSMTLIEGELQNSSENAVNYL